MRTLLPVTVLLALACGGLASPDPPPEPPASEVPPATGGAAPAGEAPAGEVPSEEAPAAEAPSEEAPAEAGEACPEGSTVQDYWQGEYPGPVVQVVEAVEVPARPEPCEPATLSCTVPPGIFHPWTREGPGAGAAYAPLRPVERYRATTAFTPDESWAPAGDHAGPDRELPAGTELEVRFYLGEGICLVALEDLEYQITCPGIGDGPPEWEPVGGQAGETRQLVEVPCQEGRPAWVDVDDALMAREEIVEGRIVGWGTVGPAEL